MSTREFIARIHEEQDGTFWAEVLDLPGCFASGRTGQLRESLEEAISLYLDEPGGGPLGGPRGSNRKLPLADGGRRDGVKVPA